MSLYIEQKNGQKLPLYINLLDTMSYRNRNVISAGYILNEFYKETVKDISKILNLTKIPRLRHYSQDIDNYYFFLNVTPNNHINFPSSIDVDKIENDSYVYFEAAIQGKIKIDEMVKLVDQYESQILEVLTQGSQITIRV